MPPAPWDRPAACSICVIVVAAKPCSANSRIAAASTRSRAAIATASPLTSKYLLTSLPGTNVGRNPSGTNRRRFWPARRTRMPPGGSEVAATRQAAAAVRMGRLVNRQALGTRREQLNTCSVRHLEAAADVAVTLLELVDRHLEVGHAKDQNRLIAVEVFGQHQPRRVRCEPDHGNSSAEAFNGEDELCAQAVRVVLDVGGHVAARLVDEVELLEHAGALRRRADKAGG